MKIKILEILVLVQISDYETHYPHTQFNLFVSMIYFFPFIYVAIYINYFFCPVLFRYFKHRVDHQTSYFYDIRPKCHCFFLSITELTEIDYHRILRRDLRA